MTSPTPGSPTLAARRRLAVVSALAVPLAFFASAATLSALDARQENSVETAFLGLLVTVVLTSIASIERAPHPLLGTTALTAALTLWALPAGETRGAVLGLVLVLGLGLVIRREARSFDGNRRASLVAAAIAGQALFRPELWLAPGFDMAFAARAILLPAAAGLAAGELQARRPGPLLPGVALVVALRGGVGVELALALTLWCAVSLGRERRRAAIGWAAVAVVILSAGLAELTSLFGPPRGGREVALTLAWIAILLPATARPRPGRKLAALAALGVTLVAAWLLPAGAALVVPLLMLAEGLPRSGAAARLQSCWSAYLVIAAAAAASYPWLRPRPVEEALALVGLQADWRSAILVAVLFWALVGAAGLIGPRSSPAPRRDAAIQTAAILALAAGMTSSALPPFRSVLPEPIVLSAAEPVRRVAMSGSAAAAVVDSYVSHGVGVSPGTPLAEVALEGPGGRRLGFVLRAGLDSGEWAARRPGLDVTVPPHWISWPAPDGAYFAQRYRAHRRFEAPQEVTELIVRRYPNLPKELELAVLHVGVRP